MSDVEWASFEARLRTYVGGRVDSRWVDDVVGDILLKLVRHRDGIGSVGNPLAYVLRVASNAIADHYRRKSVEQRALADFEQDNAIHPHEEVRQDDEAMADMARCVAPFIDNLPGKYRDALLLTEIEGLSQPAAARRLGLSTSGMKSRVQRGRAQLKQALLQCCAIEIDRRGGIVDYDPRTGDCGDECSS
ncbi:MAG: sigma-70 family RNA polymerase sigma factor [Gammaproteobacteria bacterium]|jgi:RNA polymerase sigma-70 factor (ECF subfamily)